MLEYTPWLCWIIPILGAVLTPLFAKIHQKLMNYGAVIFSFMGAVMASLMVFAYPGVLEGKSFANFFPLSVEWIKVGEVQVKVGMLVDPLSVLMANLVGWIGFLIMVYSLGYMHDDPCLPRYWFFMNLFIGNMLLLVLSDNFIQLLFGWEGVGLCSYALIGFWYKDLPEERHVKWVGEGIEEYSPSHAGMKAFLTTRVGDVFMLAAIFLIYSQAQTFNFVELQENLEWCRNLANIGLLIPTLLLLLGGPFGKSAQIPFMEWLPDAMAGPASVSALIHAATMVKAGVYLLARLFPIFYLAMHTCSPNISIYFQTIAWIGGLTAFIAATQAMVSRELKKVWAYSTVSQIGYMMLTLGVAGFLTDDLVVAAFSAVLFHLVSHALFKATLFLSSGSVIHAFESRFMDEMGGVRKIMPFTFFSMLIGALALSGIPPLSGFWSKEGILKTLTAAFSVNPQTYILFLFAILTVGLTFFYSLRALGLVFLGNKKPKPEGLREAPLLMWFPYLTLAVVTIILGISAPLFLERFFHHFYSQMIPVQRVESFLPYKETSLEWVVPLSSTFMLLMGGIPAYYFYLTRKKDIKTFIGLKPKLKKIQTFLFRRWYINLAYYKIFVYPTIILSRKAYQIPELSGLDRFNNLIAKGVISLYNQLRRTHTGIFNDYMAGLTGGLIAFLIIFLLVWLGG